MAPPAQPKSFATFESIFTTDPHRIRVELNWRLLKRLADLSDGRVRVDLLDLSPTADLAAMFAPWYRTERNGDVLWDTPGARPYSFTDLAGGILGLTAAHRAKIDDITEALRSGSTDLREIVLGTFALGGDAELVLDGNHRLAAVARTPEARPGIQVTRYRLHAPVTPEVLPDLVHWST